MRNSDKGAVILSLYDAEATTDLEARIAEAAATVGSAEHHEVEMRMAREAITLVKNDSALPLRPDGRYVLAMRTASETPIANYAVGRLQEEGLLDESANVTIGYYYDLDTGAGLLTDALATSIANADAVICIERNLRHTCPFQYT